MADTKTNIKMSKKSNSHASVEHNFSVSSESSISMDDEDSSKRVSLADLKLSWYSVESTQYDPENESKIAVLYTGGTIGMKSHGRGYEPEPDFLMRELRNMPMFHDAKYGAQFFSGTEDRPLVLPETGGSKRIVYTIFEYQPLLDSSNMSIGDYIRMACDIKEHYDKFDGFVILHGTDTMSYSASALSFMLEFLGKPVILTGSQIPIFELRSDGRDNFLGALLMAGNYIIPEVTVYFHNHLLRGNRSTKVDNGSMDAFQSPNLHPIADLGIHIKVHWNAIYRPPVNGCFRIQESMCNNVGLLRFFPSITAQTVKAFLQPPMQGVVLQTYGAGNGPDTRKDILEVLGEATKRGMIIANITQCAVGRVTAAYASGKALLDVGVIPGGDMTPEAALMKLSYVLSKTDLDLPTKRQMMGKNLRGEMTVQEPETVELSIIGKLAKTMKITSDQEMEVIKDALFPPLMCTAARKNNIEYMQQLIDSGGDVKLGDYDKRTPLHIATCEGHLDMVEFLIRHGALIHTKDRYGHMALDDAVRFRQLEVIDKLVAAGAKLQLTPLKQTLLIQNAILLEHVDDERLLETWYRAGASFTIPDQDGRTPLHVAAAQGLKAKVEIILKYGAEILVKDNNGETPLEAAKSNGHQEIVQLLEEKLNNLENKCHSTNC